MSTNESMSLDTEIKKIIQSNDTPIADLTNSFSNLIRSIDKMDNYLSYFTNILSKETEITKESTELAKVIYYRNRNMWNAIGNLYFPIRSEINGFNELYQIISEIKNIQKVIAQTRTEDMRSHYKIDINDTKEFYNLLGAMMSHIIDISTYISDLKLIERHCDSYKVSDINYCFKEYFNETVSSYMSKEITGDNLDYCVYDIINSFTNSYRLYSDDKVTLNQICSYSILTLLTVIPLHKAYAVYTKILDNISKWAKQ